MPDIWMDVDAALSEVPVNIMALIDDTDFKTRETGILYNEPGMDLAWNFVTTAGAYTQTAVVPTVGGDYDWAHQGDGMYSVEIPAAGGASINNDTEGHGWFVGYCTGVLPWRGPIIGFRAAGLNNLLIDNAYSATRGLTGTALPDAVADAAGGLPISDAGGLDLDTQIGTDIDAILADTNELQADDYPTSIAAIKAETALIVADTNELQTDDVPGLIAALNDPTAAAIADAVWDEAAAGHVDAGKAGQQLWTDLDAVLADTNELQTDDVPALIAALNDPTAATIADAVWDEDVVAAHNGADTAGAFVDDIDDILTDTAVIGALGAGLTAVPWNAAWDAEVESEVDDALGAGGVDLTAIPWNAAWDAEAQSEAADALAAFFTSAAQLVDDVWNEVSAGHTGAGAAGQQLWTDVDAILADTNELQTDDVPTLIAALNALIVALNDLSAAQVNAEVLDVLAVDTFAQPGQENPVATQTLENMLGYLYKAFRNRVTQTAAQLSLYNDDALTVDQKAAVADDGVTFSRGEMGTGP